MLPLLGLFGIHTALKYFELPQNKDTMKLPDFTFWLLYCAGLALGSSIVAPLADRYGRTKLLLIACLLAIGLSAYGYFADDSFDYSFCVCGFGVCAGIYYSVSTVYVIEIVPPEYATRYCSVLHLCVPVSSIVADLLCPRFTAWIIIICLASCSSGLFLLTYKFLWKSPSFLAALGNYSEAVSNSNGIAKINSGRRIKLDDINESMLSPRNAGDPDDSRRRAVFQYPYIWRFDSSRAYLLLFSALTCFTCLPLIGFAQLVRKPYFIPGLPLLSLPILFLLQSLLKSRTIISTLLYFMFVIGIINATLLLYTGKLYELITCLLYSLAFMSTVQSLTFAAENSPCRVRATSFGFACGVCVVGGVAGKVLGSYSENAITLFSLSSLVAIGVLRLAKKFERINRGRNDIYEAFENRRKHYKKAPMKHNMSNYSHGRESNLKHFSLLDIHTEIERCPDETSMASIEILFTHTENNFVRLPVEGYTTIDNIQEDIGITSLKAYKSGLLMADGFDHKGSFVMEGHIVSYNSFCFAKIQNEIIGAQYNGKREGCVIRGKWSEANKSGEFSLRIKGKEWKGTFTVGGICRPIEWILCIEGKTLNGVYDSKDSLYLLKGDIKEDGKLFFIMTDTLGNEREFAGHMSESKIHGKHEGKNTMTFDLTPKSAPSP